VTIDLTRIEALLAALRRRRRIVVRTMTLLRALDNSELNFGEDDGERSNS